MAGLGFGKPHGPETAVVTHPLTMAGFFGALVAALWAYDGWNNVSMVASEIRQPQRSLPLALIWGTLTVIVIYLSANAAYFHVLSAQQVGASQRVAADMMRLAHRGLGRACGFDCRDDQYLRGTQWIDSVGLSRSLRHGTRRTFFFQCGQSESGLSHARSFYNGSKFLVCVISSFRPV